MAIEFTVITNEKYKKLQDVICKRLSIYLQKAEKRGLTKIEIDEIIFLPTGYNKKTLQHQIDKEADFETFFVEAPQINPNASKITGVICGYRVEQIQDKLMQKSDIWIRWLTNWQREKQWRKF